MGKQRICILCMIAMVGFFYFSCRTAKIEALKQVTTEKVDTSGSVAIQKEYIGEQNGRLSQRQDEQQVTEIITAVFDTLDSHPVLKKLRIQRILSDRTIHSVQQMESRKVGIESLNEEQKQRSEKNSDIHSENKSKPAGIPAGLWIASAVFITLLLLFSLWKWKKIFF